MLSIGSNLGDRLALLQSVVDDLGSRVTAVSPVYETEPWGGVDHIMKIHSLNLASLKAHFEIYKVLMYGKSPLSRVQREMIAVVASAANHCKY